MPGFIIHLAEATMIINYLNKKSDTKWCYEFLMGSLLPDTRLGEEKRISHFWDETAMDHIARAPKLERFLDKYSHRLNEPVVFGYYAHLFLDEHYVNGYWPMILDFKDAAGHSEPRKAYIREVVLKQSGKHIPFKDFFTTENYYGDYTRSNHWLVERYHIEPPAFSILKDVAMEEVEAKDLRRVIEELDHICQSAHLGDEKEMAVFDLESLDAFVQKTAREFYESIQKMGLVNEDGEWQD